MRYVLMVRARPETESVEEKHALFISKVLTHELGIFSEVPNAPKEPTTDPLVEINLRASLKPPFRGILRYQNRAYLRAEARFDDYLMVEFNPRKVDIGALASDTFPALIEAFGAYFAYIADEEFIHLDFDTHRGVDIRRSVPRVYPLMYVDRQLCLESFGLGPERLVSRLGKEVCREFEGGLFVSALPRCVPFEEACALSDSLTATVRQRVS